MSITKDPSWSHSQFPQLFSLRFTVAHLLKCIQDDQHNALTCMLCRHPRRPCHPGSHSLVPSPEASRLPSLADLHSFEENWPGILWGDFPLGSVWCFLHALSRIRGRWKASPPFAMNKWVALFYNKVMPWTHLYLTWSISNVFPVYEEGCVHVILWAVNIPCFKIKAKEDQGWSCGYRAWLACTRTPRLGTRHGGTRL